MTEDTAPVEERRFAILSKNSIRITGESAGHAEVSDEVCGLLAEDSNYRVREAIQNSLKFMRHARRRRLTVEDFNKASKHSDSSVIHGHRHCDSVPFRATREGEIYVPEDLDVNLANFALSTAEPGSPTNPGQPTVKGYWLAVEGVQKGSAVSQGIAEGKLGSSISADLQLYYDNITKVILGVDEELMKLALVDLRTNRKITPLLPRFVFFVFSGVKTLNHNIKQLRKLLHTVRALINNDTLYLELRPYLSNLVHGVLYCIVEPLAASINPTNDHWALRDYGARLLAQIISDWESPLNQIKSQTILVLKRVFNDLTKPFCCHYGAVMGLVAVGAEAVQDVILPQMPIYWPHLQTVMEDISYANAQLKDDAHKVYGALLLAAELMIKANNDLLLEQIKASTKYATNEGKTEVHSESENGNDIEYNCPITMIGQLHEKDNGSSVSTKTKNFPQAFNGSDTNSLNSLYEQLYEYFGDALATKLPFEHFPLKYRKKHKQKPKKEATVVITDQVLKKSGEELLEMILRAPSPEPPKAESEEREEEMSSSVKSSVSEENYHSDDHSEQSNEQTHYDFDNEADNKSEKSFKSDKSEDNLFTEDEFQVKSVKEDPQQGIKLKITFNKRQKGKSFTESDTGSQSGESVVAIDPPELSRTEMSDKQETKRGKKRKQTVPVYATEETTKKPMFECVPMQTTETSLVLKIKGPASGEKTEVRKARPLVHSDTSDEDTPTTELHKWS